MLHNTHFSAEKFKIHQTRALPALQYMNVDRTTNSTAIKKKKKKKKKEKNNRSFQKQCTCHKSSACFQFNKQGNERFASVPPQRSHPLGCTVECSPVMVPVVLSPVSSLLCSVFFLAFLLGGNVTRAASSLQEVYWIGCAALCLPSSIHSFVPSTFLFDFSVWF